MDNKHLIRLYYSLSFVCIIILFIKIFTYSTNTPVSFDGAMNLNTAISFMSGKGYGFYYNIFFPFPAQTDGPFIFLAALILATLGISLFSTHLVNIIYIILLVILLTTLFVRMGMRYHFAIFSTLISLSIPGFFDYSLNGYGEIPAFSWFVAGALYFGFFLKDQRSKKPLIISGILLSLSYLTKVISLIMIFPFMMMLIVLYIQHILTARHIFMVITGFLLPIFSWEIFRLFSIGTVPEYIYWWNMQLHQIMNQGAGSTIDINIYNKIVNHIGILSRLLGLNVYQLIFFLFSPVLIFTLNNYNRSTIVARFYIKCFILVNICYFVWWIAISPTSMAWHRRILNGTLVLVVLNLTTINFLVKDLFFCKSYKNKLLNILWKLSLCCFLLVSVGALMLQGKTFAAPIIYRQDNSDFFKLTQAIRYLPEDSVIFGSGWWQSPVLALYSGRHFYNFERWTADQIAQLTNKFLLFDRDAITINSAYTKSVLELVDTTIVYSSRFGSLYKINAIKPYVSLDVNEIDFQRLQSSMDFSKGDYVYKRGFYQVETGGQAWMRPIALVALMRNKEQKLKTAFYVPELLIQEGEVNLSIEVEGCGRRTFALQQAGFHEVEFALECNTMQHPAPLFIHIKTDRNMPMVRQIDADNRLLAILVRSVWLSD